MNEEFQEMKEELESLQLRVDTLENFIREFAEPSAIGSEQLWEIVYHDLLRTSVPSGVDLREIINKYPELKGSLI